MIGADDSHDLIRRDGLFWHSPLESLMLVTVGGCNGLISSPTASIQTMLKARLNPSLDPTVLFGFLSRECLGRV